LSPTCRAAALETKNNRIGVIATPGTINSGAYGKQLRMADKNTVVFEKACPMFVPLVENGYINSEPTRIIAREYIEPLIEDDIDTLILGCTHYPLLTQAIHEFFPEATLINAGAEGGEQIKRILEEKDMLGAEKGENEFFVSGDVDSFVKNGSLFLGSEIKGAKKAVF
jgi:glutamate racemase